MELDKIMHSLNEAKVLLDKFISDKKNIENIGRAADLIISSIKSGAKVISFGNGGSMSDAMHFAEEMTGLFRDERRALPAIAVSDPSHISCTANDYGFDSIFSRYVEALGKKGDVVLAISTSGNSGNVIKAVEKAREMGIGVISLTGKTGGKLAALSDVEIRVPHDGYSDRIQEIHIKIIHILIELIENGLQDS